MEMKTVRFEVGEVVVECRVPEGVKLDLDLWLHSSSNSLDDAKTMLEAMEPGMDPKRMRIDDDSVKYAVEDGDDKLDFYVYLGESQAKRSAPPPHPVAAALLGRRKQAVVDTG